MKTQLMINGKLEDVEIENGNITILGQEQKKNGWERVASNDKYATVSGTNVCTCSEDNDEYDDENYLAANYFCSYDLATDIRRVQDIWRRILRFQAEEDNYVDMCENAVVKYYIYYNISEHVLDVDLTYENIIAFTPYFSTKERAKRCIEFFREDLTWLFTQFKSRIDV